MYSKFVFHIYGISTLFIYIFLRCTGNTEFSAGNSVQATARNYTVGLQTLYVYKNIRYAEPLNSSTRFERPITLEELKPQVDPDKAISCPQIYNRRNDFNSEPKYGQLIGREDCLLLDIYMTKEIGSNTNLPVFVYFHGGEFMYGSKNDYTPSYLMRNSDMIVVIPNYRLGALGFLSIDGLDLPGNMGLLDQQSALQWVYQNIQNFGGSNALITIGGHGAGAAAVTLHLVLPDSQRYFIAAVSGSGTIMDPWALTTKNQTKTEEIAKQLSCNKSSWKDMMQCLKTKTVQNILEAQHALNMTFNPVIDGVLITDTAQKLFSEKKGTKPLLAGVTRDEGSFKFNDEFEEAWKDINLDKMLEHYLYPYLIETEHKDVIIKAAKFHYLRGISGDNFEPFIEPTINLLGDFLYKSGLEKLLKSYNVPNNKTWMYVLTQTHSTNVSIGNVFGSSMNSGKYGVGHMDDIMYLFNTTFVPTLYTEDKQSKENTLIRTYTNIWRNIIMTGELPAEIDKWNTPTMDKKYSEISSLGLSPKSNYRSQEMDFWNNFVADILSINGTEEIQDMVVNTASSHVYGLTALAVILGVLCIALAAVVVIMKSRYSGKYAASSISKGHSGKDTGV